MGRRNETTPGTLRRLLALELIDTTKVNPLFPPLDAVLWPDVMFVCLCRGDRILVG